MNQLIINDLKVFLSLRLNQEVHPKDILTVDDLLKTIALACYEAKLNPQKVTTEWGEHLFQKLMPKKEFLTQNNLQAIDVLLNFKQYLPQNYFNWGSQNIMPILNGYQLNKNEVHLNYISTAPLADLAEGFIRGALRYFDRQDQYTVMNGPSHSPYQRTFVLKLNSK